MGLAPGGRMKQDIQDDPHRPDAWDQRHGSRCLVSLLNTAQWMTITGERPLTAQAYAVCGLPWFDYYGGDLQAVTGSENCGGSRAPPNMPRQRDSRLGRTTERSVHHLLSRSGNRVGGGKALAKVPKPGEFGPMHLPSSDK